MQTQSVRTNLSLPASGRCVLRWVSLLFDLKVAGGHDTEQVLNKIIPPAPHQIPVPTFTMKHIGDKQHVKTLVGLDQRIDKAHGFHGMDIVIHVSVFQQQMSSQM